MMTLFLTTSALMGKTFSHGVHPPESKNNTNKKEIRRFPFAPVFIIPLAQHIGVPAKPVVREGEEVIRGQLIAEPGGFVSAALHSPATGVIKKIGLAPVANGTMSPSIFITPHPGSSQQPLSGEYRDPNDMSREDIIKAIQQAGIVGLGGAAFPTHVKFSIPEGKSVDTLIVNGVECEPYLTTDHRVMLEQAEEIFAGIRIILKATGASKAIIGIEANKPDALVKLRAKIPDNLSVSVESCRVKYPQGAEKMLIKALLKREVPSGGLPVDVNTVVSNVATVAEIGRLIPYGQGLIERVITITGPVIKKPGNYLIPLGTPLRYIMDQVGIKEEINQIILGGPMMGMSVATLDIPITKGVSGILVPEGVARNNAKEEQIFPCIRCGDCLEACPIFLNPALLGRLARKQEYEQMAEKNHLFDCFECGACSYVCPSRIPLVQFFRLAKGHIRENKSNS